ncbi:MAG: hypothetical protein MJA84_12805, partial [Firmicutes bacterium]|nr:hypothetical protein [Bacillota bacterium]
GLNQYITQRTLGSKSLAAGQKGVVFAAFLKLLIPFIVVIPGILAFNLFNGDLKDDAVKRNALILSEKTPQLYEELSDSVKPDPDDPRNKPLIERINQNTAGSGSAAPVFYNFDPAYVKLHLEDAMRLLDHNSEQVQDRLMPVNALPAEVNDAMKGKILVVDRPADAETEEAFREARAQLAGRVPIVVDMPRIPENLDTLRKKEVRAELRKQEKETLIAFYEGVSAYGKDLSSAGTSRLTGASVSTLTAHDYDNAFPTLIRKLLPIGIGIKGFVLAAIFGAVVSSLASMLNSASTIATMDIYRKFRKNAGQHELVSAGRVFVVLFVLIAMGIAPFLGHPAFGGIFTFIQEFQGFISPGILAIFLFGLLIHRAPRYVGTVGLLLNPVL